jgi:hypothetical protein
MTAQSVPAMQKVPKVTLVQHLWAVPQAAHGHALHDGEVKYCLQVPPTQAWSGPQTLVHDPQWNGLFSSTSGARQLLPQSVVLDGQTFTQAPVEHFAAGPHDIPQAPQFNGSLLTSTQVLPHCAIPGRHAHCPEMHR